MEEGGKGGRKGRGRKCRHGEEPRADMEKSLHTAALASRSAAATGNPAVLGSLIRHVKELIIFYSDTHSCMPPGLSQDRPHPDLLDRVD